MLSVQEAMQLDFTGGSMQHMMEYLGPFDFVPNGSCSYTTSEACTPPQLVDAARTEPGKVEEEDEERLRRKISNRESARRSRARKQQRAQELERALGALRAENRELAGQLYAAARRALAVRTGNALLHAEAGALRRRLRQAQTNAVVLLRVSRLLRTAGLAVRGRAAPPHHPAASGMASLMR